MKFDYKDYPQLFKIADNYSIEGQKKYLFWLQVELVILVTAAVISLFPFSNPDYGQYVAGLSALFFAGGISITVFIKNAKFEDEWYIGRAVAESIKSLTWKFLIKGEPFKDSLSEKQAGEMFINFVNEIFDQNKGFLKVVYQKESGANITPIMRKIRLASFQERKKMYVKYRIQDQLKWYTKKSALNRKKSSQYFWIIIGLQVIALVYSIYLVINPGFFNIVPLITTLAAVILSWLQVNHHQELAQSYAVTAHEINLILDHSAYIENETQLATYIADSENAFSREHTLWLARKDVFSYKAK